MRRNRLIAALAVFLLMPRLHAHSLHQSTAEAEYNPRTKKLEVSLTVFINDLELALIRQSERRMFIDKTPAAEFDAQIVLYLAKTFVVSDAKGEKAALTWVGREIEPGTAKSDDPAVTLFFEMALPEGLGGVSLRNAVFGDLFEDQLNLLLLKADTKRRQFQFKRGDGPEKLEFEDR